MRRLVRRGLDRVLAGQGYRLTPLGAERRSDSWLDQLWDTSAPLPVGVEDELRSDNPRLAELREAYDALDWPVCQRGRWRDDVLHPWLDLRFFRGDNPYVWHYRDSEQRASALKFFVYLNYVLDRDDRSLVEKLGEDAAFGCWTYRFPGYPPCSRDLLDSVNELYFLDRQLSTFTRPGLRVLDIGAGYGRLAYRLAQSVDGVTDYCCVDAIAESTFLCEFYTGFREVVPPARVVTLPDVPSLEPESFDLACNAHSFSEMPRAAVEWWMDRVARLRVPHLFVVPNESQGFLTTECDRSRHDYGDVISAAGYELVAEEPKFTDEAIRGLIGIEDRYCLFRRSN